LDKNKSSDNKNGTICASLSNHPAVHRSMNYAGRKGGRTGIYFQHPFSKSSDRNADLVALSKVDWIIDNRRSISGS